MILENLRYVLKVFFFVRNVFDEVDKEIYP